MNTQFAAIANGIAQSTYLASLRSSTSAASQHMQYLGGRGFSNESLSAFGVGYCSGREAIREIAGMGLSPEAVESGLIVEPDGKSPYERFYNRITFPVRNHDGKVIVGFGGRTLVDGKAKYINSPESELFKKREHLYGLSMNRRSIVQSGYAILCEGYLDVIALWQIGIRNAVAPMGTALHQCQVNLLRNFTNSVLLCMDGDKAGHGSSMKSYLLLQANNFKAKARTLPDNKDPGEFALCAADDMRKIASW